MVIDTSALLAIFLSEPERQNFLELIRQDGSRLLSAPNTLETAIVLEARRGVVAGREFDLFLHRLSIEIVPVDDRSGRSRPAPGGASMVRAGIPPVSISLIALPTLCQRLLVSHSWRKATTSKNRRALPLRFEENDLINVREAPLAGRHNLTPDSIRARHQSRRIRSCVDA